MTAPFAQPLVAALAAPASGARALPIREPRARAPLHLDHGNEPALEIGTRQTAALTRRALNARWLGASVLTGLAGAALLGSAIYISSEGEITFAEPAERAPAAGQRSGEDGPGAARKGDKLVRSEVAASAKQAFRAPITLRSGDREVIKLRSFVRLASALSLTSGAYATNIAPFNPLRFFTDSAADRGAVEAGPETSDAEVSVIKSDLSMLAIDPNAPGLGDEDVAGQFREEARLRAEEGRRVAITLPAPLMLSRTLGPRGAAPDSGTSMLFPRAIDAPFRSLEVRVVPENVTTFAKTMPGSPELGFSERTIPLSRGEALEAVLRTNGAGPDDARAVVAALGGRDRAAAGEGQQLRILAAPAARPGEPRRILRAILLTERGPEAIAALNDRGTFVSVAPPTDGVRSSAGKAPAASSDDDADDEEGSGVPLYESLYETAFKHDIPRQTVEDLVRIFGYDVDFQRRVAPGDTLEILCATDEEGGERLEVLSAALKVGSDVHRVFRYQAEDGSVDYFDEAGRSLKKFLLRKPVVEARLSSGFGSRYHPILGYAKMHTGVDWATKTGTPIMAAANGTVTKAAWDSGYGRRTELQHANGYVTAYNHQSGFARGIAPGTRVRQGQIIGYVGSTGLSTGAHLHYEVIVNGHFVDPMKIRVPRGRELDGRALSDYRRQREQIDGIMQKAGSSNRLAQGDPR